MLGNHNQNLQTLLKSCVIASVILLSSTHAQLEQVDPSDIYLTFYYKEEEAKKLRTEKQYKKALKEYQEAQKLLRNIHVYHATWRPKIIKNANVRLNKSIEEVNKLIVQEKETKKGHPELIDVSTAPAPSKPDSSNKNLTEIRAEIQKNKDAITEKEAKIEISKRSIATRADLNDMIDEKNKRIRELEASNKLDQESANRQVATLNSEISDLRLQLSKPIKSPELNKLNRKVKKLEGQLSTLESENSELRQSISSHEKAAASAEAEIEELYQTSEKRKEEIDAANKKIESFDNQLISLEKQKNDSTEALSIAINQLNENKNTGPTDFLFGGDEGREIEKLQEKQKRIVSDLNTINEDKEAEISFLEEHTKLLKESLEVAQKRLADANKLKEEQVSLAQSKQEEIDNLKKGIQKSEFRKNEIKSSVTFDVENPIVEQLKNEIDELRKENELLLGRPLQSDLLAAETEIQKVKEEKNLILNTINDNSERYDLALVRVSTLQDKLEETRKVMHEFENNVTEERKTNSDIISSQRKRIALLSEELTDTQRLLTTAIAKVEKLTTLKSEADARYAELETEYEGLLAENEHLRTMIDGNSNADKLKREFANLKKEYYAQRTAYEKLLKSNTQTKENLAIARKQYIISKSSVGKAQQIIDLEVLKADKLRTQLVVAQNKLANENPEVVNRSSEEIKTLRSLVDRQLKLQDNRKQVRNIILAQAQRLAVDDADFRRALGLLETQEIVLTEYQQQILNPDSAADSVFIAPSNSTPEQREKAEAELSQKVRQHSTYGKEAYEKGRFVAAEEFFNLNIDNHPGHIPSILNVGLCRVRYGEVNADPTAIDDAIESFEDAIAISGEQKLSYAHQMLGYCYFLKNEHEIAAVEFQTSLTANPDNATAHIYLATISANNNDLKASENHLKSAIKIDATRNEPHSNLAILYKNQSKYELAWQHYKTALDKGAKPNSLLEGEIKKALPSIFN